MDQSIVPDCGMNLAPVKQKASGHDDHMNHDKHAGHSPNMFKQKFWWSLALTIPVLLFWFNPAVVPLQLARPGQPVRFGCVWADSVLVMVGWCFESAKVEIAGRQPAMMTLISWPSPWRLATA